MSSEKIAKICCIFKIIFASEKTKQHCLDKVDIMLCALYRNSQHFRHCGMTCMQTWQCGHLLLAEKCPKIVTFQLQTKIQNLHCFTGCILRDEKRSLSNFCHKSVADKTAAALLMQSSDTMTSLYPQKKLNPRTEKISSKVSSFYGVVLLRQCWQLLFYRQRQRETVLAFLFLYIPQQTKKLLF